MIDQGDLQINDDEEYRILFRMQSRKAALFVAIIGIVFSIVEIIHGAVTSKYSIAGAYGSILCAIFIVACLFIFYANYFKTSWAYLPYLITAAVGIILYGLFAAFLLIMAIFLPQFYVDYISKDSKTETRALCITFFCIIAIGEIIAIYLWLVVLKAFRHTKNVIEPAELRSSHYLIAEHDHHHHG